MRIVGVEIILELSRRQKSQYPLKGQGMPQQGKAIPTERIGSGYQIALYDFSKGGAAKQVSHAVFDGIEPCWLADGRHLVYTARDRRTSRICILDTETGKSTPISPANFGPTLQASAWWR